MIVQEPVQAAILHCLNNYDYSDAIFLAERLHAEVKTDESLFLLATAYFRNGQIDYAYYVLKDKDPTSPQCKYLLGKCAYELEKYAEAEDVITYNSFYSRNNDFDDLISEFGDQAAFMLILLAKIASKTERKKRAIEAYKCALKLNPFLWSCYESLCKIGEKPNPTNIFQLSDLDNFSHCHGVNLSNIESLIIPNNTPGKDSTGFITPDPILNSSNSTVNSKLCTPEDNMISNSMCFSGFKLLPPTGMKPMKLFGGAEQTPSPSFGVLEDFSIMPIVATPTLSESFTKKVMGSLISRREILQNSKPVFSQSSNVTNTIPMSPTTPVRRSSRLFSNNYSVKENNKSPNRGKFATPKSPSRKTKQRLNKCSLNEFNNYMDLNARNNKLKKEKTETVTSTDTKPSAINNNARSNNNCNGPVTPMQIQKHSAEGLMCLMRDIGKAYLLLSQFDCKSAIEEFMALPTHQFHTSWVYSMIGLAYFEMAEYENCANFFGEIRLMEPYRVECMDIYSTALWHLQKEVELSALAQDLVQMNKTHSVTWVVSGNCFSLHKEHDTAIKFLNRAVQVNPSFPYAYTLLGHEYIMTEELDKAMGCYRNAVRLDPRHYNAWFGIGTIYSKQERYVLAKMNYNKALSINPNNSVIMCHIGVVQHALKLSTEALNTLNKAISQNPKNPLCKFHRGSIYFAQGRHAEALRELEELKEIVPKESLVYYLIGKVHKKLGNTDLALMHFSWATDLDPKGASSQIKEAFDPSIGRSGEDTETPASPSLQLFQNQIEAGQQLQESLNEDSDDSL